MSRPLATLTDQELKARVDADVVLALNHRMEAGLAPLFSWEIRRMWRDQYRAVKRLRDQEQRNGDYAGRVRRAMRRHALAIRGHRKESRS